MFSLESQGKDWGLREIVRLISFVPAYVCLQNSFSLQVDNGSLYNWTIPTCMVWEWQDVDKTFNVA